MNILSDDPALFAAKIAEADEKLETLEKEISEIGQPACNTLRKRLDALRIEEKALKRNFAEAQHQSTPDSHRLEQIEALLLHIEREEASLEHEADFLHQSPPSSVTLVAETGARMFGAVGRGVKGILKGRHPLGSSVFVNHSYETLVTRYGLKRENADPPAEKSDSD